MSRSSIVVPAVACLALLASPAMADLTSTVKLFDSYGSNGGGEFLVQYSNFSFTPVGTGLDPQGRFESFCLERTETIGFNTTYYVELNDEAVTGGGGPNPDPIGNETAYLYQQFVEGNLNGYDYGTGNGRKHSANALQNAIWYLEQEITNKYLDLNGTERNLVDLFLADAAAHAGNSIGSVRVMNLYANADGTGHKQDQLVMTHVPAPGAALLGMIGLAGVGYVRRRFA
ncbi:MAG: hypothetical protein JXQ73_15525 [Phycisphaerae bacterium]|nr:hypothetical protein [Phycisphaerae bacterium]